MHTDLAHFGDREGGTVTEQEMMVQDKDPDLLTWD